MPEKIIERKDIPEHYQFSVSLTSHPVVEDKHGVLRYQKNPLIAYLQEQADLNEMWIIYRKYHTWTQEQFMQFYRDIGYSLHGFEEIWGEALDEMEGNKGNGN